MRIVHVTHRAWPVVGGAERHVHEIAARQVQDGHRVTVIASDAEDLSALWDRRGRRLAPDTPSEYRGVRVRRIALRHLPLGSVSFPALRRLTRLLSLLSPRAALPLARFSPWLPGLDSALPEEGGDLVFAWNITLEGLTMAAAQDARKRSVPWVAVPLLHLGRPRFYTMPHQIMLLKRADVVLAQAPTDRRFLVEHGLQSERVHTIGPGVDLEPASTADGERFRREYGIQGPMVLAIGPPSREKGIPHLLAAMHRLWDEGLRATLVLIGRGMADAEGLPGELAGPYGPLVRRLGPVAEPDKWDAIDAADVVALPSRTESFGIVYLEAWARRKPVIGAREGAVVDVIDDGIDGLLVGFGDVPQLAGAIRTLLDDPEMAAGMGERGYQKVVGGYQWHQQYGRLRALVAEVVAA